MSLRDTIQAVRNEVAQASGKSEAAETAVKKGVQRGSAANAKPAREKAASVHAEGKKPASSSILGTKKTKEQKEAERAERRKEREEEDYKNQAFQLLLSQNPEYKKTDRVWWILLGIGFVATLISLVVTFVFPVQDGNYGSTNGVVSIACLIIAYAFILASFIFDWVKRRPIRKEAEAKMAGMSNKKIAQMFAKEREEQAERKAAKEAAKAEKAAKK